MLSTVATFCGGFLSAPLADLEFMADGMLLLLLLLLLSRLLLLMRLLLLGLLGLGIPTSFEDGT
jgi:hypothetical protein